ncbi:MAG: methionine synthase [Fervidobacterium sp.]
MKIFIPDKYHYMPSKKIFLARTGVRYKSALNDEKLMEIVNRVYLIGLSNVAPVVYWDVFYKDSIPNDAIPEKFSDYKKFIICASTLGDKFDLVVDKLSEESTMMGMLLDAWGSEALETLNEYFQLDYLQSFSIKTSMRFSPGYGDLDITVNSIYVQLLDIEEKVKVNRFGIMLPRKTTTFIAGIND